MRDPHNIIAVSRLRPDFMGFIFYAPSPRYVGENFEMPATLDRATKRIGVFVNERNEVIVEKVKKHQLDLVQLHGDESVEQCLALKQAGIKVIKVFSVDDNMNFKVTHQYTDAVDYFLFDTRGKYYGGNAARFDWSMLSRYDQQKPFFLSGGIAPQHVEEIIALKDMNLAAIDVNSGVEISPALKDIKKIEAIKAILNRKY